MLSVFLLSDSMPVNGLTTGAQTAATSSRKLNILFIMGDGLGWRRVGVYQRGIGLGETPNH